jgi:hypothetical protein
MSAPQPSDEAMARVAKELFHDAHYIVEARGRDNAWSTISARTRMEYERYARDLLLGEVEFAQEDDLAVTDLEDISIQDIPTAIHTLQQRYERVMGHIPQ